MNEKVMQEKSHNRNRIDHGNAIGKGVLLAIISVIAPVALAATENDSNSSFWQLLGYAIAGGLASKLARRRASRRENRKKRVLDVERGSLSLETSESNGMPEVVDMLSICKNEIADAEAASGIRCTFCGCGVSEDETYDVDFENYRYSDGRRDAITIMVPCCKECRDDALMNGVNMARLRKCPNVCDAIAHGACFSYEWLVEQDKIKKQQLAKAKKGKAKL